MITSDATPDFSFTLVRLAGDRRVPPTRFGDGVDTRSTPFFGF